MSKIILCFLFFNFVFNFKIYARTLQKQLTVCMVLDRGGKDDKSFNESAVNGFVRAKNEFLLSSKSKFLEIQSDAQIQQYLRVFSKDPDCSLIITVGFNPSSYVKNFAESNPLKKYLAIDMEVNSKHNNVRSALFKEDEGAFLIGSIAAIKSKTKTIGMIGGMDIPMMKRFALAYEAGAKHVSSKSKVLFNIIGPTPLAWNNPSRAKEIAFSQFAQNVDIIFQVAGPSGLGVFDAVKLKNADNPKQKYFAIGVDSNQNSMSPGQILTSMEKHVDVAVYSTIQDLQQNHFSGGVRHFNLRNGGVDWAFDNNNKSLFSAFEVRKINLIRQGIIEGKVVVPDYYELQHKKNSQKI